MTTVPTDHGLRAGQTRTERVPGGLRTVTHHGDRITSTIETTEASYETGVVEVDGRRVEISIDRRPATETTTITADGLTYSSKAPASARTVVDGRPGVDYRGHRAVTVTLEEAARDTLADLAERDAYTALAAELRVIVGTAPAGTIPAGPALTVRDVKIGDTVWAYSRGRYRRGRVVKVGRSKITVAYVTPSGPYTVTRPAVDEVFASLV